MADPKREKIHSETIVTSAEIACVLGVTSRRVHQMVDEGVISTVGKNEYVLTDCVQRYIKFLNRNLPDEDDTKLERAKRVAETQLKASKARMAKLEAEELEGKMHRSEDVAAVTGDLIYTIRSALIALPGRVAVDAAAAQTPAEAQTVIRKEVFRVMQELSEHEYDPEEYEARVRERLQWDAAKEDDDDE